MHVRSRPMPLTSSPSICEIQGIPGSLQTWSLLTQRSSDDFLADSRLG